MSLKVENKRANEAEKLLFTAAKKIGNPRLAALASRVRLDAFSKVTEQIDGMVKDLKQEKADDIKQKDYCVEEINNNERAQELKARDIDGLDAKIAALTATIDKLAKEISALQAEVAEMQKQLKRAGEDREAENAEFKTTIADQRATQKLLTNALNVLKAVYAKKSFEAFVKDTNKSIEEASRAITNKTEEKATAEADKTAAEEDKNSAMNEQQQNQNENADLHKACDFTLNNFE